MNSYIKKNQKTIVDQCKELGIKKGTSLFIHSSIRAVGGGVKACELIEALFCAVGKDGTLLFPTFTSREEEYFIPSLTPSVMGAVAEEFRKMPGVIRSLNPRHPVAAKGPMAKKLLIDHEKAIGPCSEGTPFFKHARSGGQILLIGVDLDTLTLLHTAEALLDLAYLNVMEARYMDEEGGIKTVEMKQVPGGHRGGVRSFEKVFREHGIIRYGRIGNAVTILIDADKALDIMTDILKKDPLAALCPGNSCPDCETFKARIRGRKLAENNINISILLPSMPEDVDAFDDMLRHFSTTDIGYLTKKEFEIKELTKGHKILPAPGEIVSYKSLPKGCGGLVYYPLRAAQQGIQPFYDVLYKNKCREFVTDIFIEDGITRIQGESEKALLYLPYLDKGERLKLGEGHAQLREIVSAMRMRNFSGTYHIVIPDTVDMISVTYDLLKEFYEIIP